MRRNFILNLADGAVYAFGLGLIARSTVLPVLIHRGGGGSLAIGLIPVLWIVGSNVPQLLSASRVGRTKSLHRFVLLTALLQRLPWGILAIAIWMAPASWTVELALIGLALAAIAGGLNQPVWFELIAKLTPTGLRGRLFGLRAFLGGALGAVSGWVTYETLQNVSYPNSFALLCAAAFVATMVSYGFLTLLKDAEPEETSHKSDGVAGLLGGIGGRLRARKPYAWYLAADVLIVLSTLSSAFIAVVAIERLQLPDHAAGGFTIAAMGVGTLSSVLFGELADRLGHRYNLIIAGLASVACCVVAASGTVVWAFYLAFGLAAITEGIRTLSRLSFIAELCGEQDRAAHVAIGNLMVVPVALVGILVGPLVATFGYQTLFVLAALAAVMSVLIMVFRVIEPRHHAKPAQSHV